MGEYSGLFVRLGNVNGVLYEYRDDVYFLNNDARYNGTLPPTWDIIKRVTPYNAFTYSWMYEKTSLEAMVENGRMVLIEPWRETTKQTTKERIKETTMKSLTNEYRINNLSEPEKSFQKMAIKDADGSITDAGKDLFIAWLFEKNKEEFFKDAVNPMLDNKPL